jgi:hypothetical protein
MEQSLLLETGRKDKMDEIKNLLDAWKQGEFINYDGLKSAYEAIELLVQKVETLEAEINNLTK